MTQLIAHKLTTSITLYWSQVTDQNFGSLRTTGYFGGQPKITAWFPVGQPLLFYLLIILIRTLDRGHIGQIPDVNAEQDKVNQFDVGNKKDPTQQW